MQNLFGLDALTELDPRSAGDVRSSLLRVLTDLYVHRLSHTPDEERHYTELALRLLETADVATRVAVAGQLARYQSPPPAVWQWLRDDLPEVAAALGGPAPAQPSALLEHMATVETASDEEARPSDAFAGIDAASAGELNELFFSADAVERRLILLNLDVVAPAAAVGTGVPYDSSVSGRLEVAALGGNREGFVHELTRALRIPRDQARRIARDPSGEPVVVAAKALGMPREVLYRVLMFVNPAVGHSVARVHALAALNDEITRQAAAGMVAIWQALPQDEGAGTRHQPLMWDDATRQRPRSGVTTQFTPVAVPAGQRHRAS